MSESKLGDLKPRRATEENVKGGASTKPAPTKYPYKDTTTTSDGKSSLTTDTKSLSTVGSDPCVAPIPKSSGGF